MTTLLDTLLGSTDWTAERTSVGSAEDVPEAVAGLLSVASDEQAEAWYWRLDNRVVVQGQLFGAAIALIPVLLVALLTNIKEPVRYWLIELMMQIGAGESHASEIDQDLGDVARGALKEGLWVIYAQLADDSPRVRAAAVDLLALVDADAPRVSAVVHALVGGDKSEEVQRAAARLSRPGDAIS